MRVVVDGDPGHDDLITILVAARVAELVLVTTVAGNASLSETTANALVAADLAGFDGPVVSGAGRPRRLPPGSQPGVHGDNGLGDVERPATARSIAGEDAARAIVDHTTAGTWIIATGPLTNVAAAIDADPQLARRVAGISFMGGSGDDGVEDGEEFNLASDPEAAEVVLRSGATIVQCPLALTRQVRYDTAWIRTVPVPLVREVLDHYLAHHRHGGQGAPLHDPCALIAVTHPDLFGFEEGPRGRVARTVDAGAVLDLVRDALDPA